MEVCIYRFPPSSVVAVFKYHVSLAVCDVRRLSPQVFVLFIAKGFLLFSITFVQVA